MGRDSIQNRTFDELAVGDAASSSKVWFWMLSLSIGAFGGQAVASHTRHSAARGLAVQGAPLPLTASVG